MEKGGGVIEELRSSETKGNKVGGGLRKRRAPGEFIQVEGFMGRKKGIGFIFSSEEGMLSQSTIGR